MQNVPEYINSANSSFQLNTQEPINGMYKNITTCLK